MPRGEIADRDERGRISPKVTDEEIVDAVRENEPASTTDVSEAVGIEANPTRDRLKRLSEDENSPVTGQKVGNSFVWTVKA
jgi:predicted ArsR family transcriptional regulator